MTPSAWLMPFALLLAGAGVSPRPAPARFVTEEHGLTFATPVHSTYCPLPADFTGSDHGTILFLTPPARCADGAGYPSIARGFEPDTVPRIEIFYAYADPDYTPECRRVVGSIALFGAARRLCLEDAGKQRVYKTDATYPADLDTILILTLVTTPARATEDLKAFEALAASASPCSSILSPVDEQGKRSGPAIPLGSGPRCPDDAEYF